MNLHKKASDYLRRGLNEASKQQSFGGYQFLRKYS